MTVGDSIGHSTLKGDYTETAWVKWLKTYLPERYEVSDAIVIDSDGNTSDQIDVVIYDRVFSPPVMKNNGITYITAESVYAVFEVKQDLNKKNIEYAVKKAESVKCLKRTNAKIMNTTGKQDTAIKPIISGLITTSSINGNSVKSYLKTEVGRSLDISCSVNGGTYVQSDFGLLVYDKDLSLVSFLYSLLSKLQMVGSVSAIDYNKYLKNIL